MKYPNFYSLWFGTKYLFVTDDPSIAQKLLTYPECVEKNFFMELFGFPNGLISLKCEWKKRESLFEGKKWKGLQVGWFGSSGTALECFIVLMCLTRLEPIWSDKNKNHELEF